VAQTINIANIKIGMDVDELKKSGQFTRNELASLTRTIKASEAPSEKLARDLALLDRAFAAGGISAKRYAEAVEHLKKKHIDASAATTQHKTAAESLRNLAATYVGLGAAAAGIKKSIQLAAELETNKIAFEVMTGSAGKAEQMLNQFKQLDVRSPIAYGDFATAGKTLLQFGMQAQAVPGILERLSAISLGNTAQFQSLALAFGQVQANGRLMGGEVLQMINAGFNPLQEISRTTGISMVDLKKAMEAGGISAQMVADAFRTATEAGGLFYGMNEKLANSMAGQWSKLEGDIKAAAIAIGTDLMPLLTQAMALVREGASGGGGDGERGIVGFNIKLIADSYASLFAGINAGANSLRDGLQSANIAAPLDALVAGFNATLDHHQSLIDAEKEREDALMMAALQEEEIAKKKEEELAAAKELAEVEKQRAAEDKARTDKLAKDIEHQKKMGDELNKMREEFDRLALGEDEARRKRQRDAGYSEIDIGRFETMQNLIEKEKERKQAMEDAKAIEKEMMTDKQKAVDEIARLQTAYEGLSMEDKTGTLGQANLAKQQQIAQRFAADQSKEQASNIAPSIKAGTVEAFKFLQQSQTKQKEQQEQLELQKKILKEAEEANRLAQTAPRLAFAR
jgi:tape measure domain-containing protein